MLKKTLGILQKESDEEKKISVATPICVPLCIPSVCIRVQVPSMPPPGGGRELWFLRAYHGFPTLIAQPLTFLPLWRWCNWGQQELGSGVESDLKPTIMIVHIVEHWLTQCKSSKGFPPLSLPITTALLQKFMRTIIWQIRNKTSIQSLITCRKVREPEGQTHISHAGRGGHFCWNWLGWRPHNYNHQNLPSRWGVWWGCCGPGTASSALWTADSGHWRTAGWRSRSHGEAGQEHGMCMFCDWGPYVLCWLRWRALTLALRETEEVTHWKGAWGLGPLSFLRDLSPSQGPSELWKSDSEDGTHRCRMMSVFDQVTTYKDKAAPPLLIPRSQEVGPWPVPLDISVVSAPESSSHPMCPTTSSSCVIFLSWTSINFFLELSLTSEKRRPLALYNSMSVGEASLPALCRTFHTLGRHSLLGK